jgi:hypothetical protein
MRSRSVPPFNAHMQQYLNTRPPRSTRSNLAVDTRMEQTEILQKVISPSLTGLDPFDSCGQCGDFQLPEANFDELLEELACYAPDQVGVPPDETTDAMTDALPDFHALPNNVWGQVAEEQTLAENVPASSMVDTACEGAPGNVCEHGNPNGQCPICKKEAALRCQRADDVEEAMLACERARKGIEAAGRAINQAELLKAAREVVSARTK